MKSGNITLAISDHLPSFFVIPRDNQNHFPKKQNLYTRNTNIFDRVYFICDYPEIDWDTVREANKNDANKSMKSFLTKMNELLDKCMPLRKITKKEYKRRFKPWITEAILRKMENNNKMFKKYTNARNPTRKEHFYTQYKTQKNEITPLTRQSKKDYYNQYFTENTNNLQTIWKGIKEIINIKIKNLDHPTCIEENDSITDPKEIAESFNNYFTTIDEDILNNRNI